MTDVEEPDNVIEITIAHSRRWSATKKKCLHKRVTIDEELLDMLCNDCGVRVNPIKWMIHREERFQEHIDGYRRYTDARAAYDKKTRCKCEHCGRITRVREPSEKEIEVERRARIAEGSLLEIKT